MAYAHNTNYGSMFKNKEKQTENSPEYIGELNVEGVVYFIDAWVKEGQASKYLSFRVKRKEKQPQQQAEDFTL